MSFQFDPNPAAAVLLQAWKAQQQMQALPSQIAPANLDSGYCVQDRLVDLTHLVIQKCHSRRARSGW
jgi:2-keto-4-pentenoate hydratase